MFTTQTFLAVFLLYDQPKHRPISAKYFFLADQNQPKKISQKGQFCNSAECCFTLSSKQKRDRIKTKKPNVKWPRTCCYLYLRWRVGYYLLMKLVYKQTKLLPLAYANTQTKKLLFYSLFQNVVHIKKTITSAIICNGHTYDHYPLCPTFTIIFAAVSLRLYLAHPNKSLPLSTLNKIQNFGWTYTSQLQSSIGTNI